MQSNSDNSSVTAAMVAAFVTRKQVANESAANNAMKIYLEKLRDLVPHCPKNRSVSKLELIQHVIDYINDLQETLQNSADPNSPPPSPSTPLSFTEAFSHLSFNEDGSLRGIKERPPFVDVIPVSYNAYSSDGASDYESRGSSPINNSDTDCSSDQYCPLQYRSLHTGPPCNNPLTLPCPHPHASLSSIPATTDPRRVFRKGYGLPAHLLG